MPINTSITFLYNTGCYIAKQNCVIIEKHKRRQPLNDLEWPSQAHQHFGQTHQTEMGPGEINLLSIYSALHTVQLQVDVIWNTLI